MRCFISIMFAVLMVLPLLASTDNDAPKADVTRVGTTTAKQSEADKSARDKAGSVKPLPEISAEQEAVAVALVQKHHKDLFELLIYLKEGLPQEYEQAIRDLSRASDRLALYEKRDPARYRLELQLWQAESRRQLLTARLQMGFDESLLKELREVLKEEHRLDLALLRHERERLAGRLAKIDEQIAEQEKSVDAAVERKFTTLTRAAKNSERNVNSKNKKPAVRKNTKDPT